MNASRCIITGCALVSPYGEEWVAGDLFEAGDCYVFNGNYHAKDVQAMWLPIATCHYVKRLQPTDWWERRGVFVMPKHMAALNSAAQEYIKGPA